jgi:hypothetical protein
MGAPNSFTWKGDIGKNIENMHKLLCNIYGTVGGDEINYSKYLKFYPERLERVFDFYEKYCYSILNEVLVGITDKNNIRFIDRHKIIAAYSLSLLVKDNLLIEFDTDKYEEDGHTDKIPFALLSPMEVFVSRFIPAYLLEFMKKESCNYEKINTGAYRVYYPNHIRVYKNPLSPQEQEYSDYYENFLRLLVYIREDLNKFGDFGEPSECKYPFKSMILTLSNALFLLEAASDCGKFPQFCDQYFI